MQLVFHFEIAWEMFLICVVDQGLYIFIEYMYMIICILYDWFNDSLLNDLR